MNIFLKIYANLHLISVETLEYSAFLVTQRWGGTKWLIVAFSCTIWGSFREQISLIDSTWWLLLIKKSFLWNFNNFLFRSNLKSNGKFKFLEFSEQKSLHRACHIIHRLIHSYTRAFCINSSFQSWEKSPSHKRRWINCNKANRLHNDSNAQKIRFTMARMHPAIWSAQIAQALNKDKICNVSSFLLAFLPPIVSLRFSQMHFSCLTDN